MRLSASLSPPYRSAASDDGKGGSEKGGRRLRCRTVEAPEIDLSRASPFGPLSQINARRTFAYLIATLNASHPDYDFSHLLRPADFRKERSLRSIMQTIDSTLLNLRPTKPSTTYLAPPALPSSAPVAGTVTQAGTEIWSPRMWQLLDNEMGLRQCEKYSYTPDDDPFDASSGEGSSALWSMHYFFFNKERRRVAYLHLRALSVISHSPVHAPVLSKSRPAGVQRKVSSVSVGEGASKRASYWLGQHVSADDLDYSAEDDEDDDDEDMPVDPADDEIEVPYMDLDAIRGELADGSFGYDRSYDGAYHDNDFLYADDFESWSPEEVREYVRGVSEEVGERMEL